MIDLCLDCDVPDRGYDLDDDSFSCSDCACDSCSDFSFSLIPPVGVMIVLSLGYIKKLVYSRIKKPR